MIFELEPTFWKRHWFSSLDVIDLLNLLQTCRFFQKHKMYMYKLIFVIAVREGESIVSSHISYEKILYPQKKINISANTIRNINRVGNESVIELIKIVQLFLHNRHLNKFMMRRCRSKNSIDLKFAMIFKKYFIDRDCCSDVYSICKCHGTQMDKFLNYVFNNRNITYLDD